MDDLEKVQRSDMIDCIKREIGMRKRVYPRRVDLGQMTQEKADREVVVMEAILALLSGPSLL